MSRFQWALSGDSFLDNGLSGWRTLIDAFTRESASTLYIPGDLSESERLLIEKGCGSCAPHLLGNRYSGGNCRAEMHDCAGIISFAPARSYTFPSSYGGKRVAAVGGMDPCDWSRQIEASRNYGFLDVFSGTGTISFTEKTQPEYLFRTLLPQCVSIMARLP